MTNTEINSININLITETNDNCNEIQHKRLQCGNQEIIHYTNQQSIGLTKCLPFALTNACTRLHHCLTAVSIT